jgi:hypothetical protein
VVLNVSVGQLRMDPYSGAGISLSRSELVLHEPSPLAEYLFRFEALHLLGDPPEH